MKMIAFGTLLTVLMFSGTLSGVTLRVPSQYATIQEAVDACNAGDEILIASGTYGGSTELPLVSISGKHGLTLRSETGNESTVLAGGSSVLIISDSYDINVQGLTLANGFVQNVLITGSAGVSIRDCSIADGSNPGDQKGGICIESPQSLGGLYYFEVSNSRICGNNGPGISSDFSQPWYDNHAYIISDNEICNNSSSGIRLQEWLLSFPSPVSEIKRNKIHHNGWAGIHLNSTRSSIIEGNLVYRNDGCGIYAAGWVSVRNNTIAANGNDGIQWAGSMIPTIERNIIVSSGNAGIRGDPRGVPIVDCNDVWNNMSGNYVNAAPSSSDISVDPLFCGISLDDYSLYSSSPALHLDCGTMGAIATSGCGAQTAVQPSTWGSIKAMYR
jgi:parallel beta-helix repeat protein